MIEKLASIKLPLKLHVIILHGNHIKSIQFMLSYSYKGIEAPAVVLDKYEVPRLIPLIGFRGVDN